MKKKMISICMVIILAFCMSISAFAAEPEAESSEDIGIEFSKLQALFPEIPLNEDGTVDGYGNGSRSYSNEQGEVIETYTSEYENGICDLDIYSDGTYIAAGCEEIPISQRSFDVGYDSQGNSYYKSYLSMGSCGFNYTYSKSNGSNNFARIQNLGNLKVWTYLPSTYFTANSLSYDQQNQTTSSSARVHGDANIYQTLFNGSSYDSVYNGRYRLITTASYSNIRVSYELYF